MKKKLLVVTIGLLCLVSGAFAQTSVFNPNDPLITYDPAHPPATPPNDRIVKWVRSVRMSWNSDKFKAYYYNGMAFRLRYPNNFNPADPAKKYPMILFLHGGGEREYLTDNELHLFVGAQFFEQKIDAGEFDGFMLFPQLLPGEAWNYAYYLKVNQVLDSLQKYVNMDQDKVITMGISNGGYGAISYASDFPQRSATVISSSPALIGLATERQPNMLQIPTWIGYGGHDDNPDPASVENYADAFKSKGGDIRLSLASELGHVSWGPQWAMPNGLSSYWNNAHKANPLIYFKRNKFSSQSAINAKLGITWGFAQYQWQKDNIDIPGAVSNEYSPTQFGTYRVHFKRQANSEWSDWSTVPAVISLDNTAPTTPGNLKVVYTSRNAAYLDWDNATDNDTVATYDVYVNGAKMFTTSASAITADKLSSNTPYNFTVKAVDNAGNQSASSNQVSGTTSTFANGLNYRLYQGIWDTMPNFNLLTPTVIGSTPNVDIAIRTPGVNDFFGFVWEGYINIPTPGTYTFEINSDDGSRLYFNSMYTPFVRPLIDNGGQHAPWAGTGSVEIATAGLYPISMAFFEKWSGEVMEVYWSGPNLPRQRIPNSAFVESPSDNVPPSVPGNLKALYTGRTFVHLDWDNSTDNLALKGYDIYVNGIKKYTTGESAVTADSLNPGTDYTFTVQAIDLSGNPSGSSLPVGAKTESIANGLKYRYYEGSWDVLPNFNTLTPLRTGSVANVNLGIRTPGRNDNFAFVWEGYINIPTAGSYTFELESDDGSKLYFKSFYSPTATALVSNDGLHGAYPISATVIVPVAGIYPIAITFFEKDGGESMKLSWSGPGLPKQVIPDAAFTDPSGDVVAPSVPANLRTLYNGRTFVNLDWDNSIDNVGVTTYDIYVNGDKKYTTNESAITADKLNPSTNYIFTVKALDVAGNASASSAALSAATTASTSGLKYRYYEGTWDFLPNFNALTPVSTGSTPNIDMSVRTPGRNDNFAFVWEGYINLQVIGTYTFELNSDDGSKLYFNSFYSPTAVPLVNSDGLHAPYPVAGTVTITETGLYPIAMTFFEKGGGELMQVFISGPGLPRQLVPDMAFSGTSLQLSSVNLLNNTANSISADAAKKLQAYPNPVSDMLNIDFYNESQQNNVRVNIYDLNGKLVFNKYFGNIPAGNNILKMNLAGSRIAPGVYFAKLDINGIPSKVIKVVKAVR